MSGFGEVDKLAADLRGAALRVQASAPAVVQRNGVKLRDLARELCPKLSGKLSRSISVSALAGGLIADVGPTLFYGQFVEFGTSKMGPEPFMGPSGDRIEPEFAADMEKLGGQIL